MSKLNTLATHFHTYNLVRKEELIPCLYSQRQTVAKSQGWVTWQWQVPLRTAIKLPCAYAELKRWGGCGQTSKQANNKSKAGWKKVVRLELVCAGKCGHTQALIVARDGMTGWTDRCILCALWKNTYRCVYTCNYILQYIKTDVFKVHLDDGSILSVLHVSYSDRTYIHTRSLVCVLITIYLYIRLFKWPITSINRSTELVPVSFRDLVDLRN